MGYDIGFAPTEEMMRKYNIHSLVVVNDSSEFVGIIDTFSCM